VQRDADGRHVLDRMDGPDGVLQLVAFDEDDSLQFGVAREGGEAVARIPVHGPSSDYEPYAYRTGGWAVAFGAVPPNAAHAEIRNEDGDVFPATIVPLPSELVSSDRAAWGLIDRFEVECPVVSFDGSGNPLGIIGTIGDFAVAPRTPIGEGDDPVGGHWRLWISHLDLGPMLNVSYEGGRSGCGVGKLPGAGFGTGGRGSRVLPEPRSWEVSGLVTSEADRVEVTTSRGVKPAVLLTVPRREFGPCKAYVAFFSGDEEPSSLTAFDADSEALATLDY
jgi:hypothetical protein